MPRVSDQGIALIKKLEGFSKKIYLCPAGKETIGYGHVILPGEHFPASGISEEVAEKILCDDLGDIINGLNLILKVGLNQNQIDALICFIFNIGIGAFRLSTMLRMINNNDFNGAAKQFARWVYCNGKKIDGLVKRRAIEAELFKKSA